MEYFCFFFPHLTHCIGAYVFKRDDIESGRMRKIRSSDPPVLLGSFITISRLLLVVGLFILFSLGSTTLAPPVRFLIKDVSPSEEHRRIRREDSMARKGFRLYFLENLAHPQTFVTSIYSSSCYFQYFLLEGASVVFPKITIYSHCSFYFFCWIVK